jgi:hypothetical protein
MIPVPCICEYDTIDVVPPHESDSELSAYYLASDNYTLTAT